MTDDEIADRIVRLLQFGSLLKDRQISLNDGWLSDFLDDAEAYRLVFISDVRERAAVRSQAKRVRAKVFAALGVTDRKGAGK
jgi:hypothetical protein